MTAINKRISGGADGYTSSFANSALTWESVAIEAVGNVIEFWGFKRNQGRVWALLFLRGEALSAGGIQEQLGLSKGAVSMLIRDLESWSVIQRTRRPDKTGWCFEANTNLMEMVVRVLSRRELEFLNHVVADLARAKKMVDEDPIASKEVKRKVRNMHRLGSGVHDAVSVFAKTAQLDFRGVTSLLMGRARGIGRETR